FSVTTKGMEGLWFDRPGHFSGLRAGGGPDPVEPAPVSAPRRCADRLRTRDRRPALTPSLSRKRERGSRCQAGVASFTDPVALRRRASDAAGYLALPTGFEPVF